MRWIVRSMLPAAMLGSLCGAAMAADLSTVGQWLDKYPDETPAGGKSLWEQPGVEVVVQFP